MNQEKIQKEIEQILYLMRLKHVTRWGFQRDTNDPTESVAEHVYGLMVLAKYFLPILDPENRLDKQKIYDMILWHDTGEIETGDIPTFQKTQSDTNLELEALDSARTKTPMSLSQEIYKSAVEYETQNGPEVDFMKMLDKTEGAFELLSNPAVAKMRYAKQRVTKDMFINKRLFIAKTHPIAFEYVKEITEQLDATGAFYFQ